MSKKAIGIFLFILLAGAEARAAFTFGPYLQIGNQTIEEPNIRTRITVCWETDAAAGGRVYYGGSPDLLDQWVEDPAISTRHEVEIIGLEPDTVYFYQVTAGADTGPVSYFRTAPDDPHSPFSFGIIGDTRTNHTEHQMVIDMMRSWSPDFYVHSGDMVNTGGLLSDWDFFFAIETTLMQYSPMAPSLGNHELAGGTFYDRFMALPLNLNVIEDYYSWEYGSVHFLHLSTEFSITDANAQNTKIYQDLRKAAAGYPNPRFIVVVFHRPAYSNSRHGGDENYPYSTIWGPLFELADVAMVIQGHDHCYERFEPIDNRSGTGDPPGEPDVIRRGVTYVTSGAGGAPIYTVEPPPGLGGTRGWPPLDSLAAFGQLDGNIYEAGLAEVQGGRMDVTFYRAEDGSTLDRFTIIRNEKPTADAGEDIRGSVFSRITLDGSGSSDPENDLLSYRWRQVSGPAVELDRPRSETPGFLPFSTGIYVFSLTVSDGIDSDRDTVTVAVSLFAGGDGGDGDNELCLCGEIALSQGGYDLVNLIYLVVPFALWLISRAKRFKRSPR